ncbi:MAG: hypothetical protein ACTTID_00715 [Bacillales bacterium]
MNNLNLYGLDFIDLLLEYYKELNIQESELSVILMIDHFIKQRIKLITIELLKTKMNLDSVVIDSILTNLYKKNYINFDIDGVDHKINLKPLNSILYNKVKEKILNEEEIKNDNKKNELREKISCIIEDVYNRPLNPIEISFIEGWVCHDINFKLIENAIKDCVENKTLTMDDFNNAIYKRTQKNYFNE